MTKPQPSIDRDTSGLRRSVVRATPRTPNARDPRLPPAAFSLAGLPETRDLTGRRVTFRPMTPADKTALLGFFQRIPPGDRRYLRDDFTAPEVIERWLRARNSTGLMPLLAVDGGRVVGYGTLRRHEAVGRRHIGEVRIVVEPMSRNDGIGRTLLQALTHVARAADAGLEKIIFEVVPDAEQAAIHAASALGFSKATAYTEHVRYYDGAPHDLAVYELRLSQPSVGEDPTAYMY